MQSVIGRKIGQTQAFLTNGMRIPVTVVSVEDMPVLSLKTKDVHGYTALQVGFGVRKKVTKQLLGHVKSAHLSVVPQIIREMKTDTVATVGEVIKPEDVLKAGDIVKVTGMSKGKGFAGVVKRHNFRGGPRTHGQSDRERAPGSIGQTTTPGRVYRGKRMAGRMGQENVTLANLLVMDTIVNGGKKTMLIKGLVPGSVNSIVVIEKTGEVTEKKFVPLLGTDKPGIAEEGLLENEAVVPAEEIKIEEKK